MLTLSTPLSHDYPKFMKLIVSTLMAGFIVLFSASSALAAEPVSKSRFKSVAIGGQDTVAYHSLSTSPHAPSVTGKKAYTVKYKGANWRFLNKESADLFAANPENYEPAYNGHCANALSLGKGLVKTDGTHWEMFDDKLYLFYAANGRARWMDGNWETYKVASDAAWDTLSK